MSYNKVYNQGSTFAVNTITGSLDQGCIELASGNDYYVYLNSPINGQSSTTTYLYGGGGSGGNGKGNGNSGGHAIYVSSDVNNVNIYNSIYSYICLYTLLSNKIIYEHTFLIKFLSFLTML